jgi:thiaminase
MTDNSTNRFVFTTLTYAYISHMFNTTTTLHILYIITAILCTATEYIYITNFNNTWAYKNATVLHTIPSWLIPLWAVTIVVMYNIIHRFSNRIN